MRGFGLLVLTLWGLSLHADPPESQGPTPPQKSLPCGFRELFPSAYPAERLQIRVVEPQHREDYLALLESDRLREVSNNNLPPEAAAANFDYLMEQQNTYKWTSRSYGLFLPGTEKLVGVVEFFNREEGTAYVGFALAPEYWTNGLGAEAVSSVIQQAPSLLKINRLRGGASQADTETNEALLRAGFRKVGEGWETIRGERVRGNYYEMTEFPDPANPS